MKHAPTHRIGVFAIVRNSAGQVLLSRRADSGWWNLPGGGMEPDETVAEAMIREVREETGLEIAVVRLVGVYSKPQKSEVVLTFECSVIGGVLSTTDEAEANQWFAPNALPSDKFLPKHRERVEDALLNQPTPIIKDQREPSLRDQQ